MTEIGRIIAFTGVVLVAVGLVVWGLGRAGFRGLPGDIVWQTNGARVYIPIVTMLVLSPLLTALIWLWQWLRGGWIGSDAIS